jgi:hypothetical protein
MILLVAMADKKVIQLSDFVKTLPSPAEGLRLIKAFSKITDAKRRAKVIAFAEKIAAHASRPKKSK